MSWKPDWVDLKSAVQVGGVVLLADVDCFMNLPLPIALFCTSYLCCIPVHWVLLLASMCGNTIFQVLHLHCVPVFLQSFRFFPVSPVYTCSHSPQGTTYMTPFFVSSTAVFTLIRDRLSLRPDLKTSTRMSITAWVCTQFSSQAASSDSP